MKAMKKLIALVLALTMILSVSATALAADDAPTIKTFTSGMTIPAHSEVVYKVTVTDTTYFKAVLKSDGGSYGAAVVLYSHKPTAANMKKYGEDIKSYTIINGKAPTFTLPKGTYYITINSEKSLKLYKLTTTRTNSTRAKATALKSGKTEVTAQTSEQTSYRWFKVTLSTAKALTVYTDCTESIATDKGAACPAIKLYNASGKSVKLSYTANKQSFYDGVLAKYTTAKLAKGTYYIRVGYTKKNVQPINCPEAGQPAFYRCVSVMWK